MKIIKGLFDYIFTRQPTIDIRKDIEKHNNKKEIEFNIESNFKIDDIYRTYNIICENINYKVKLEKGSPPFRKDEIYINQIRCTSVFSSTFDGRYASSNYLRSLIAEAIEEYKKYLEVKKDLSTFKEGEIKSVKVQKEEYLKRISNLN